MILPRRLKKSRRIILQSAQNEGLDYSSINVSMSGLVMGRLYYQRIKCKQLLQDQLALCSLNDVLPWDVFHYHQECN